MRWLALVIACVALAGPIAHERERERDVPLAIYRDGAAELAVRDRVARAESQKLKHRPRGPTVPGTTWVSLGPTESAATSNAGRINDIVIDPRDPRVVYIASSGGGVWKTFDVTAEAVTWLPLSDVEPSVAAGALAIDPDAPDTLYVGYGDFYHTTGDTVARTTDGGVTWSPPVELAGTYPAPSGLPAHVSGIRSIGVHGQRVLVGTDVGLFASTDAGDHFALVDLPDRSGKIDPEAIWSIVHTGDDHWIVTGVTGCDERSLPLGVRTSGQDPGPSCRDGNDGAIWTSADGTSWTLATLPQTTGIGRIDVAAAGGTAYAMVGSVDLFSVVGFWRSPDGGRTWTDATGTLANPAGDCPDLSLSSPQSWYDQVIAVDPTDPAHVLVGGSLCGARTLNGTAAQPTWELVAHWAPDDGGGTTANGQLSYVHADWHSGAIVAAGGEVRAFVGCDGGLFTSSNLFASQAEHVTWKERNRGLATNLMYSVASGDPATGNPFVLFGGLQDNGTYYRTDPSTPWRFEEVVGGDGIGAVVHSATSGTTYFASIQGFRVYCRPQSGACDNPSSWNDVPPLAEPRPVDDSEPFLVHYGNVDRDTTGPSVLTHTVGRVFVNVGTTTPQFIPISQDLTGLGQVFTSVAASLATAGVYGASAASGFRGSGPSPAPFYVTTAGNTLATWTAARPVQPAGTTFHMAAASAIAFPPVVPAGTQPGQVYIGGFIGALDDPFRTPPPDDQGRLYRTRDFGQTWQSIAGADPAHRLPNVAVYVVKYDPMAPATIYAGTDLGLYISLDDGATWDRMGDGLPLVPVRDIYVARNQDFIRVATFGRGLWEIYPSAMASHGALGDGDYDRNQRIDWIDVGALAARLGETPATPTPPLYSWIMDIAPGDADPPLPLIDDRDFTALLARVGRTP